MRVSRFQQPFSLQPLIPVSRPRIRPTTPSSLAAALSVCTNCCDRSINIKALTAQASRIAAGSRSKPNRISQFPRPFSASPTIDTAKPSAMASASLVESAKKAAAYQAVKDHLDPSYRYVGIGSGSTVVYVVEAIAALPKDVTDKMIFVPTGYQSKLLIIAAGLKLGSIDLRPVDPGHGGRVRMLDVAFDGADEVDGELNLIKGGGACLWQEKFVASAAKKFVCVADYRKISPRLCTKWKYIPIEVHPLTAADVLRELVAMGSPEPKVRQGGSAKAGPVVTDNNMWLIDAPFTPLLTSSDLDDQANQGKGENGSWEVSALAAKIKSLLGVCEVGLFYGLNGPQATEAGLDRQGQKPVAAYFGMEDGTVKVQNA